MSSLVRIPRTVSSVIIQVLIVLSPGMLPGQTATTTLPKGTSSLADADSLFIGAYQRKNDIRIFYGTQGVNLQYGARHESATSTPSRFENVNDFAGFGFTYKLLDLDLSFSLPKTRILNNDLQNLSQFKFGLSYSTRKWILRGYYSTMTGIIAADPEGQFNSHPDVTQTKLGAQITFILNDRKYSYRGAVYQNEFQRRTAGSFLLRIEPFYRTLGAGSRMVPAALDVPQVYGEQVGLQYLKAPGLLVMPGYGFTLKSPDGNLYLAPIIFAGPGVAFNYYTGDQGDFAYTNWELGGMLSLNAGFNNSRVYANVGLTDEINYVPLNPTYFLTNTLRITLTVGYRLNALENFLPSHL